MWIIHNFQIIGEASSKTSIEFRSRFPEIPWRQIIAMRNIIVHEYFGIDLDEVWNTVENMIPDLKLKIKKLLETLN